MNALRRVFCLMPLLAGGGWLHAEDTPAPLPTTPPKDKATKDKEAEAAKQAAQFVQQLAAEAYMDRAEARTKLMELGRPAIEPLESGAQSEDPEIRLRCMEILIAMRGRGFMGVGLMEENQDVSEFGDGGDNDSAEPFVQANQIIDFRQGFQQNYGVKRPFPAEAAGIKTGDRLLSVNDRRIRGIKDLMREVILIGPARVCSLMVERDGVKIRIPVLLTRNPMQQRSNPFGGNESVKDPAPQVDLEKEIDFSEEDKRVELQKNDAPAPAGDEGMMIQIEP